MTGFKACVVVFGVFLLGGCVYSGQASAKSIPQHEAGAVYVSVLNAMPFEQYAAELSPEIEYSFAKALEQVAKASSTEEFAERDAFTMMLKLGITDQGLPAKDLAKEAEEAEDDADKVAAKALSEGTSMPPMMQYSAAMALYQEIKLLEKSVLRAARKKRYTPYIVRVQISVMPFKRNLPYDVYSTLSFFDENVLWKDPGNGLIRDTLGPLFFSVGIKGASSKKVVLPMVVPLLVSENLEFEAYSRSAQVYREYGLALIAAYENVGAQGNLQKVVDQLRKQTGSDYNALLTTARVTDNSIRVRLGAMRSPKAEEEGDSGYEMVPRNHVVSFLLFVPDEGSTDKDSQRKLGIVANTQMRDNDGKLLKSRSFKERNKLIEDKLKNRLFPGIKKVPPKAFTDFYKAVNAVLLNNWDEFREATSSMVHRIQIQNGLEPDVDVNNYLLWTEVASVIEGEPMSYTTFEVTKDGLRLPSYASEENEKPPLFIGDTHLSAEFSGGAGLCGRELAVVLRLGNGKGPVLPAKKIEILSDGTGFVATFASPKDLGLPLKYIGSAPVADVMLVAGGEDQKDKYNLFPIYIKEKPSADAKVQLTVSVLEKLPLLKGATTGTLVVTFSDRKVNKEKHDLVVRIDGCDEKDNGEIKSADQGDKAKLGKRLDGGWRVLTGTGRFNIELMNLYNGLPLAVEYGLMPQEGKKAVSDTKSAKRVIVLGEGYF